VDKGIDWIREKAKVQSNKIYWYCYDAIDLKQYDFIPEWDRPTMKNYDYKLKFDSKFLEKQVPCVANYIQNIPLKGHNLFWVWTTIFLKERWGLGPDQISQIIKPYLEKHKRDDGLGRDDWEHYYIHDDLPKSIFRSGYFFPSCNKLMESGYCVGKCKYYDNRGLYKE